MNIHKYIAPKDIPNNQEEVKAKSAIGFANWLKEKCTLLSDNTSEFYYRGTCYGVSDLYKLYLESL